MRPSLYAFNKENALARASDVSKFVRIDIRWSAIDYGKLDITPILDCYLSLGKYNYWSSMVRCYRLPFASPCVGARGRICITAPWDRTKTRMENSFFVKSVAARSQLASSTFSSTEQSKRIIARTFNWKFKPALTGSSFPILIADWGHKLGIIGRLNSTWKTDKSPISPDL